jgi:hypothetical protein
MLHSTADQHTTQNCTQWDEWENYTPTQKANLKSFAMSSMDALQVIISPSNSQWCSLQCLPSTGFSGPGKSAQANR